MSPLSPTWRMDAARAYLDALWYRGLTLEVEGGELILPLGETEAEINLVRLLKPELLELTRNGGEAAGRAPPCQP